jgi:hypothetical protein
MRVFNNTTLKTNIPSGIRQINFFLGAFFTVYSRSLKLPMNIKLYWPGVLLFAVTNVFSQERASTNISPVTSLSFLTPGVSYETGIGKNQSLYFQGYMATSFAFGYSDALGSDFQFSLDPALRVQYRYYYNAGKRLAKGKRIAMNSMNYISTVFETVFSKKRISIDQFVEDNRRLINTIGLLWGMQRNYHSRFSLDLNLGLGYLFTKGTVGSPSGVSSSINVSEFTPLIKLTLGFWLNNRK